MNTNKEPTFPCLPASFHSEDLAVVLVRRSFSKQRFGPAMASKNWGRGARSSLGETELLGHRSECLAWVNYHLTAAGADTIQDLTTGPLSHCLSRSATPPVSYWLSLSLILAHSLSHTATSSVSYWLTLCLLLPHPLSHTGWSSLALPLCPPPPHYAFLNLHYHNHCNCLIHGGTNG